MLYVYMLVLYVKAAICIFRIICIGCYMFSTTYCIFILYIEYGYLGYYMFICLLCVNYVHSTCAECTSWFVMLYYVLLWYSRFGRRLVIRISVPSLTLCHFVHLTNKRLVTCNCN